MAEEVQQPMIEYSYSVAQNWGFTAALTVGSVLSIFGSSCILRFAWSNQTWQQKLPYHRLVAGLAMADILFSIGSILQSFAVPPSLAVNVPTTMLIGSYTTCSIAGVLFWTFATTSAIYNGCLSINFILIVVFNWTSTSMVRVFERIAHSVAWLWPMCFMIPAALTQSISPQDRNFVPMCVVDTFPSDCTESEDIACFRGESFAKLFRLMLYGTIFVSLVSGVFGTLWVYLSFRIQVRRSLLQSSFSTITPHRKALLSETTTRCVKFMLVYTNAGLWLALGNILETFFEVSIHYPRFWYALQLLAVGFYPLQGFLNMIIYARPYFVAYRRENPNLNFPRSFFSVLNNRVEVSDNRIETLDTRVIEGLP